MRIFISGKMTGEPNYNLLAFKAAEIELSNLDNTVLNPANHIPIYAPESIPHESYMQIAYAMIDACDAVYFLKGWNSSPGATMEMNYATNKGKRILFQP